MGSTKNEKALVMDRNTSWTDWHTSWDETYSSSLQGGFLHVYKENDFKFSVQVYTDFYI